MPGLGTILGGFGRAYPAYQQQQQEQEINKMKLQQALREMALQDQNRKAQAQALQNFGSMTGTGPGGAVTPQQLASISNGNPDAFNMLNTAVRPANTGLFNIDRTQIQQQGANERNQNTVNGALDRTQMQQQGADTRNQRTVSGAMDRTQMQQQGANARNQNTIGAKKNSASNPVNLAALPEYKTAKAEFDQAKQDERAIERNYQMNPGAAYNDPQWLDARKRSIAAQNKMESIQSKAQKTADKEAAAAPAALQIPAEAVKQLKEGLITTFGNGQKWTLKDGQPTQVQ